MSMSVTVLCPGGRRQVVKVTPNTSLLQILEEACGKQKLDAKSFNLMHYNRRLDLSSSVRFASLPNRAQLELAASEESRVDSDVTLALQLPDGQRLVKQFPCAATLYEVLADHSVLPSDDLTVPVCIYARREVAGAAALKATTIRSLGLTGGKAILRYAPRPANQEAGSQAHVSAPLVKPAAPDSQSAPLAAAASQSQTAVSPGRDDVTTRPPPAVCDVTQASSEPVLAAGAAPAATEQPMTVDEASDCPSPPAPLSVSVSRDASSAEASRATSSTSGDAFLMEGASLGSSAGSSQMEVQEQEEERTVFLGERQAVAFSLDDAASGSAQPELPDDFYDVTVNDARRRLAQLREELSAMDNSPLLTAGQREARRQADLLTRLSAHRHCVVRVQFPDRLVLQGVFLSTDTVQVVMDFTAQFLEDPAAKFTLFVTPPKTPLAPSARLFEVDCVPAALVHAAAAGGATVALSPSVRSRLSSPAGAALALRGVRSDPSSESTGTACADSGSVSGSGSASGSASGSGSSAGARSRVARPAAASGSTERGVPKWFKMGPK
ncbi:tether containing UBX domain for GLUT4-like [Amphibalanus amphitrite]|uniref:tether containing UBX domain for GLUT4-like n=1 Tax=Amphibalanus amphitrite TaxID=1232801 RepID=UPI001C9182E1|nr:tether containing UBX domain for GLUT4-like [Amphibalanus amphitrite]